MSADDPLDRIDRAILRHLQAEGRLTNEALASRVHLSPSACLARPRQHERRGSIQADPARLDPYQVGVGLVLLVQVSLEDHAPEALERFEAAVTAIPQVVEASHVSGDVDYLLKVGVTDMSEWNRLREQLTAESLGVHRVTTLVLMRKPKIFTGFPVD